MSGPDERDRGSSPDPGVPPEGADGPGAGEPQPHGFVEELREEIHEVVEHVPAPVRWTIRRIVMLVTFGLLGLIALLIASAMLYVANRTEWVAKEITLLINQTLASRSDVALSIGDLRGNPLTGLRVVHPVLRFREGDLPPLLEAESMRLTYSAWTLLSGGPGPIDIEITRPVVLLPRGADGKMRLPKWKSGKPSPGLSRLLEVRLVLKDGKVRGPGINPGIEGLDARAVAKLGAGTQVDLERLKWRVGPWGTVLENLRARIDVADSVRMSVTELRSTDLKMTGSAAWKAGGGPKSVRARIERVRWSWLALVFDNDVFDVPGTAKIDVDVRGGPNWRGDFRSSLTWNDLPAEASGSFTYAGQTLAVAPMEARTPSGRVKGRFDMVGKRWALDARAEHSDPRAWKAFKLEGWPEGDLNGAFRITENERKDLDLTARLTNSTLAGWHADSASVRYHAPSATTDTFIVNFHRRGGTVRLEAGTRKWGWVGQYVARAFPLEEWPDGGRSGLSGMLREGQGTVVSRDGELHVTGTLVGDRGEWLGTQFANWRLDGVSGRLLPTPDLVAAAKLSNVMFLGLHFDSTRSALRLGDNRAALDTVAAWAGDTLLRVSGDAAWTPSGWTLGLDRAEAMSRHFHWTAEPPVTLRGDPAGVVFERLVAHDGEAGLEAHGRWAAPGGTYEFDAATTRLDLARIGLPDEWQLDGHADARLRVRGPSGDPVWNFDAGCVRPGERGHHADSLSVSLGGAQHRLDLGHLSFSAAGGRLGATGRVEGTRRAWPDTLTADGVVRWLADAAAWEGAVHSENLSLEELDPLLSQPVGWSGRLGGDLTVGGSPSDPALVAKLEVLPFAWKEFRLDRLAVDATLTDHRLRVGNLEMSRAGVVSTIRGSMPLDLALGRRVSVPEAPMDWAAQIPQGDLAILPAFVPQIGWSRGRFVLGATVTGTAQHPRLAGALTVREGAVRLAGREEVLDQVKADFHFDETRLTLDSLSARQGSEGRVRASGAIELKGFAVRDYRFDLALRAFTATEAGLYAAQMDGDFVVTNGPRVRGAILPQVAGQVNLKRAAVLFDFANQTETQQLAASTQPLFWTYRVKVDASRNLHWQPADGDIEFSADLTLEQTADSLLIYGDLRAERGTYYFLSNRFNITRADITFDNESGVNPQLDIEAVARVVPTQESNNLGNSSESKPHNVTAKVTGRSAEPEVNFSSDPPDWDESKILRELTVGRFYDQNQGGVQLRDPLDHYLTRAINRTVSAEMSRAFRGYINEWALEREQGGLLQGQGDLVLGVGTQITPNLSLRYRQVLPGLGRAAPGRSDVIDLFQRQVEAEYRLNRFFYLTTELAQRRLGATATSTVTGTDFNVNLKARWEY